MASDDDLADGSSQWLYAQGAVVNDEDGFWWHIRDRYVDVDNGDRMYWIEDATWTEGKYYSAEWVEERFEAAGWKTDTKPAHDRGYRVNGSLCGPSSVGFWMGHSCVSDGECEACGETTEGDADLIVSLQDREREAVWIDCQACGEWTVFHGNPAPEDAPYV